MIFSSEISASSSHTIQGMFHKVSFTSRWEQCYVLNKILHFLSSDCSRLGEKLSTATPSPDQRCQRMMVFDHGIEHFQSGDNPQPWRLGILKSYTRLSLFCSSLQPFCVIYDVSSSQGKPKCLSRFTCGQSDYSSVSGDKLVCPTDTALFN